MHSSRHSVDSLDSHSSRHAHDDGSGCHRNPTLTLRFDPETVRIESSPFGLLIDLPDGRTDGTPGGPALPIIVVEAALPAGTSVRRVDTGVRDTVVLAEEAFVAPLQPAAPGMRVCTDFDRVRDDGLVRPWAKPRVVLPDPELYSQAIARGKHTATITHIDTSGPQSIATVTVRPIAIAEDGKLLLHRSIEITLVLDLLDDRPQEQHDADEERVRFGSRAQAERWVELTRSRVFNPSTVVDIGSSIGYMLAQAEYLIITDNQRWDAEAIRPIGPADGDLKAEFDRLAASKRAKGMSARVVTVTDIVNGRFGRFAGSCRRDLQEVLREFIKFAHANWGTAWLLLGGDIGIIPVRNVAGYVGGFSPQATDPPDAGNSFWTGTFLKVRANVSADTPLLRASDGQRIPYDASGTSGPAQLGWMFTDASYTMRSTMPTGFVRVNGPAARVNTELFWLTDDNTIPTDLYYADVHGYPERSPNGQFVTFVEPRFSTSVSRDLDIRRICDGHDWDNVGNGLYGQWNNSADLDGVRYRADISVGRAPVGNAAEAKTFVDKVLRYESAGWYLSTAWLNKLLMVSANWGGRTDCWPASPLVANSYIKRPGDDHATIQLAAPALSFGGHLISVVTESDNREVPFRNDASASVRGWRFALSATDPSASVKVITMPWGATVQLPLPSPWIVVYGAAAEMAPIRFILDESVADGSMTDQEALRTQLAADVPNWSNVRRLYEDEIDLPPAALGGASLEHLTAERLHDRLDEGQHIVSLSGHGYYGGCCGLTPLMKTTLNNGGHTFIAYADSCLTNQFDVEDAVSESLVQNDHGGAVAYVGNTRFSWISVGDDFQRHFFKGLPATRALGLLHDRRLTMVNANTGFWQMYNRWSIFALNLIGDPEMRVWTRRPRSLCLVVSDVVRLRERLAVQVLIDHQPAIGALVTVQQNGVIRQVRTDRAGNAHLDIDAAAPGEASVTAFHPQSALTSTVVRVKALESIDESRCAPSTTESTT